MWTDASLSCSPEAYRQPSPCLPRSTLTEVYSCISPCWERHCHQTFVSSGGGEDEHHDRCHSRIPWARRTFPSPILWITASIFCLSRSISFIIGTPRLKEFGIKAARIRNCLRNVLGTTGFENRFFSESSSSKNDLILHSSQKQNEPGVKDEMVGSCFV